MWVWEEEMIGNLMRLIACNDYYYNKNNNNCYYDYIAVYFLDE